MLFTSQNNISKREASISNVPPEGLEHIYKEDLYRALFGKIKQYIKVESVDNLEEGEALNLHTQICILNKDELYKIFDLLERLKNASNQIPGHLIDEIKSILV